MSRGYVRSDAELLPQVELILTQTVFQVQLTYLSKHIFHITTIQTGTLVSENIKKQQQKKKTFYFYIILISGCVGTRIFPSMHRGKAGEHILCLIKSV